MSFTYTTEHDLAAWLYPFPTAEELLAFTEEYEVAWRGWINWLLAEGHFSKETIREAKEASAAGPVLTALQARGFALRRATHEHRWTRAYPVEQRLEAAVNLLDDAPLGVLLSWEALQVQLSDANIKQELRRLYGDNETRPKVIPLDDAPEDKRKQSGRRLDPERVAALNAAYESTTPAEREYLLALLHQGTERKAASSLGLRKTTFHDRLTAARSTAQPAYFDHLGEEPSAFVSLRRAEHTFRRTSRQQMDPE